MAKLTAWLVTLIGVLLILPLIGISELNRIIEWAIPLAVLAIGIGKLTRNYKPRKSRR